LWPICPTHRLRLKLAKQDGSRQAPRGDGGGSSALFGQCELSEFLWEPPERYKALASLSHASPESLPPERPTAWPASPAPRRPGAGWRLGKERETKSSMLKDRAHCFLSLAIVPLCISLHHPSFLFLSLCLASMCSSTWHLMLTFGKKMASIGSPVMGECTSLPSAQTQRPETPTMHEPQRTSQLRVLQMSHNHSVPFITHAASRSQCTAAAPHAGTCGRPAQSQGPS
jgi:hypothetical protein